MFVELRKLLCSGAIRRYRSSNIIKKKEVKENGI